MGKLLPFPKLPTQKPKPEPEPNEYDSASIIRYSDGRREAWLRNGDIRVFWTLAEFLKWKSDQGR